MKRLLSFLLASCLLLSLPAAQAANRDMRQVNAEIDPGMKMLVETVLGAAVFTGTRGLEENMQPAPALVEAAFAMGLYNLSLPHGGEDLLDNRAAVPAEEAAQLYGLLFASGSFSMPAAASVSGVSVRGGGFDIDLTALQNAPMIGAYIYAVDAEEADDSGPTEVDVAADLYSYYGDFSADAADLPEDALTWLCNAEIALERAPETAYGYRVRRFVLSEAYEDGMLSDWQPVENAAYEYSVNVPSIMGLAQDDPAHMVFQTADGSASLRIDAEALNGRGADQVLSGFLAANPERQLVREEAFTRYYSTGEGNYQLWVISNALDLYYHVTLQFPPERQAEYTLYSEFIRNSLIAWGISNG